MRVLIVDDVYKAKLNTLKEYAELHPVTMDDMLDLHNKDILPVGDSPNHVVMLGVPLGIRVAYSIEQHVIGDRRHLSMSISDDEDKMPHPTIVEQVMETLGFKNKLDQLEVWIESIPTNKEGAINVAEFI